MVAALLLGFTKLAWAQRLPTVELQAGLYKITAEVAANQASRQLGLMHRNFIPMDEGMLFVFEYRDTHCFWLCISRIRLDIAFIADDGKIVNIEEMKAMNEDNHCPSKPVRFALEMNQAWFTKRNISAGHTIYGLPTP
jgi:uncharacterized membrane protein (UPF0127 family)